MLPGSGGPHPSKIIVVHEGENVRLRCAATGNPRPAVEWRRLDASVIPLGSWQGRNSSILLHSNYSACHVNTRRISTNSPITTPKASAHVALTYKLVSRFRMWTGWHLVRITVGLQVLLNEMFGDNSFLYRRMLISYIIGHKCLLPDLYVFRLIVYSDAMLYKTYSGDGIVKKTTFSVSTP